MPPNNNDSQDKNDTPVPPSSSTPPIPPSEESQPGEPPIEPFEMPSDPSATTATPVTPPKNRKKLVIIGGVIAAVLVILASVAALAFVWYQSPEKVMGDALQNAVSSESVSGSGQVKFQEKSSSGVEQEIVGSFSAAASGTKGMLDSDFTINGSKVGLTFMSTGEKQSYIKVKNLKDLVSSSLSEDVASGPMKAFIDKVGDKWVRLDSRSSGAATKQYSQQQACIDTAMDAFTKSDVQRNQLSDAYKKHPVFTIKPKGEQIINSVESLRYEITPNESNYAAFITEVKKAEVFKALDTCVDGDLTRAADESVKDYGKGDSSANTTTEVWIAKWQHYFTQFKATSGSSTSSVTLSFAPVFDRPVSVTAPTESIPIEEAVNAFTSGLFGSPLINGVNQPVRVN